MQDKCCAKGCTRKADYKKHKLCRTHYARYRKNGNIGEAPINAWKKLKPFQMVSEDKNSVLVDA